MLAARAIAQDFDDPLSGLAVEDIPKPVAAPGWSVVRVVAAALNPHDLWTLRGVGHPADRIPIVLGCDGAGYDEHGRPVIIYPTLGDPARGRGDITLDPQRSLLSETADGTLAEYVAVPTEHLIPKPDWLTFDEAGALPVAWGTAYRMLFTRGNVVPGDRVLVQGSLGGVASAAIRLAAAAGAIVYATSRTEEGRAFARELGAVVSLAPGERVPEQVDVVIETVGEATWANSLRALRRGGTVVVAGATSGSQPPADLSRVFFHQQRIIGSTGSTLDELQRAIRTMGAAGLRPVIDGAVPLTGVQAGLDRLARGGIAGKIVVRVAEE
jgi:NADPH:quinone reductase-like Zn-dependent oxidoreductase